MLNIPDKNFSAVAGNAPKVVVVPNEPADVASGLAKLCDLVPVRLQRMEIEPRSSYNEEHTQAGDCEGVFSIHEEPARRLWRFVMGVFGLPYLAPPCGP